MERESQARTGSDRGDLKILVVDDRASVCDIISRLLALLGIRSISAARSGADALRLIAEAADPFDVAIFDIDMPADDGLVCMRKLAAFARKPAVILMSGKDPLVLESAKRLGQSLGVTILGALQKPLTREDLATLLDAPGTPSDTGNKATQLMLTGPEVAIAFSQGRFDLWFQPQHSLAARRTTGAEALLRLHHEERGLLTPDTFIRPAEESGLIAPLTEFVLEQAALWCAAWNAAGRALTVSVNLSKAGLQDVTLPDRAAAICARRGIAPSQMTLELTESTLATDNAILLDIISRFRLKGFRLSLDDFGTGYASLEELRLLPFHELKLDKQFVQSAIDNPRSRAILEGSIGLARDLGMTTVAEGIESEATLRLVSELGCDVAQGFLFSRPMPADRVLAWLDLQKEAGTGPAVESPAESQAVASPSLEPPLTEIVLRFAHDVASPLMMVLALSEMLLDDPSFAAEHRDDLTRIHNASREVTTMLRALQAQTRGSGGRTKYSTATPRHSVSKPDTQD